MLAMAQNLVAYNSDKLIQIGRQAINIINSENYWVEANLNCTHIFIQKIEVDIGLFFYIFFEQV